MADEAKTEQASKGGQGPISQQAIYGKIQVWTDEILGVLHAMLSDRNPSFRIAAAKVLLNKIAPDLKAMEIHGGVNDDGTTRPIYINCGTGFVPTTLQIQGSPTPSTSTISSTITDTDIEEEKNA